MPFKVIISNRAEANLDAIMQYLNENWSAQVRCNFLTTLSTKLEYLSEMPFMYPESKLKAGVRKCVITKQVTLYYRVEEDRVEIITIQDSRTNPADIDL
ncbi:MAG: type II toxin-antitoxin system RelE/ParE family toxin [Microscillaceae bacterium]|jgi:plasmid stabilization system protein ParE|nr:type II toxin-antitoxin system RelE/ParE family toxin [Microscillaceae bacterium]